MTDRILKQRKPYKKIAKRKIPPRPGDTTPKEIDVKKPTTKIRAPRKPVTIESHLEKYETLFKLLDAEIDRRARERENGTRIFRSIRKNVKSMKKDVPKLANAKRRNTNRSTNKTSGFILKCEITDELAKFMQVSKDDPPSRREITNAICMYACIKPGENRPQMTKWEHLNPGGKRNLQDPNNKMAIIPDAVLSTLLGYDEYRKDVKAGKISKKVRNKTTGETKEVVVEDDALYYWVIQRLMKQHIVKTLKTKSE